MQQLARTMVMERTTVVRALRPLLRCGFIASVYDGGSKRRLTLDITDAGLAKQKEAAIYWRAAQEDFERRFGTTEAEQLRSELFRVAIDLADDG
jgi:DNA-binding MarR family transcriptional regulator